MNKKNFSRDGIQNGLRPYIVLPGKIRVPVLYTDRRVVAIDKPYGWILAPVHWIYTGRNLQRALEEAIEKRVEWVRRLHVKYLRYIHRLDAECTGVLLLARSEGVLRAMTRLFQAGKVKKLYLALVEGSVKKEYWTVDLPLKTLKEEHPVRVIVDRRSGKPALTRFWRIGSPFHVAGGAVTLVAVEPLTGRTHQIRVHAAACGHPVLGDALYGPRQKASFPLALRATRYVFTDPFDRKLKDIQAPHTGFLKQFEVLSEILEALELFLKSWPQDESNASNDGSNLREKRSN